MRTEADNLDAESKIAKALNELRFIRPFYSAIYESLERLEDDSLLTMGVTTNSMLYNKKFIEEIPFQEFMFINLHEICHVALMHVTRRKNRNPQLWNIAADLYVNKILALEFDIEPGKKSDKFNIKFPSIGCYCSTVDINNESVEDIYDSIMNNLIEQGYNESNTLVKGNRFKVIYRGKSNAPSTLSNSKYGTFEFDIEITGEANDIIETNSSQLEKEEELKRLLTDAKIKSEMRDAGNTAGFIERLVDNILNSHIDWKKLLRKYCIKASSYDSSFSNPDRRMYYQKAIYPGQKLDDILQIKGVKICFDSSGSISSTDIAYFYGQVKNLMKQFKIDSEVIYWDTEAYVEGKANTIDNILNKNIHGGGGTDPSCLFEYFDSKRCTVKPVVTVIFTDGYLYGSLHNTKWNKKYKDTIWVMTKGYNQNFKPNFGIVTKAQYSD